ncbi:hypothetical protein BGW38_002223 [Lunasporangiospora selenospora]|uniref:RRM domain-containing protein n=1 Tax=Lunasporangiospora selenospora TaxID=979761 RepID=A0A9P6FT09_9FUNG|nr:hypothetical protein BGW38_002223 [Lunasporangiospora selenospora]
MAARFLDMALDDVVKSRNNNNRSPALRRPGGRGGGRDTPTRSNRSSPYSRTPEDRWAHDKFDDNSSKASGGRGDQQRGNSGPAGAQDSEANTKITVENLHYAVTLEDIKELFDTHAGPVKFAEVKYDLSGRSTGVATIRFKSAGDAAVAIKKLNGVSLDGQPMKVTYAPLPTNIARKQERKAGPTKDSSRSIFSRLGASEADIASRLGKPNQLPKEAPAGRPQNQPNNQGGNTRKPQSQGGNTRKPQTQGTSGRQRPHHKTVEELDAEMDSYMAEYIWNVFALLLEFH